MNFLSLSWKIFFITLFLWFIPALFWYGSISFEREWERSIIHENQRIAKSYQGILEKLLHEDEAFASQLSLEKSPRQYLVSQRQGAILVDGYSDEWYSYQEHQLQARNGSDASKLSLIEDKNFVYGLIEINDNHVVYRNNIQTSRSNDMLRLDLGYGYWLFQAIAPGRINIQQEFGNGFKTISSILAVWQENTDGYVIEFRVPKALVGNKISAILYDVDDKKKANYKSNYQGVFTFTNFSYLPLSRERDNNWLLDSELIQKRITLINSNGDLIVQTGMLFPDGHADSYKKASRLSSPFTREIYEKGVALSSEGNNTKRFVSRSGYSLSKNKRTLGAVIVESSLLKEKNSMQKYRMVGLVVFGIIWLITIVLIVKQSNKFKARIAFLNKLTEKANEIDSEEVDFSQIQIKGNDEIDQLSYNLIYYNDRLEQRREHQQKLLARLNHELRTPLAIIGSSLDNLELSDLSPDDLTLLKNARAGQQRLTLSFNRLSEANRLEESIDKVPLEYFNLSDLLESLLSSYKNNWSNQEFVQVGNKSNYKIYGSEDLFAQMFDKIVSNAIDFSQKGEPIVVELSQIKGDLSLTVTNNGPLIEKGKLKSIFNLMESSRTGPGQSNLGLGLYIAKLIARKHKAKILATNKTDGSGVQIQLLWKKKSYVVLA